MAAVAVAAVVAGANPAGNYLVCSSISLKRPTSVGRFSFLPPRCKISHLTGITDQPQLGPTVASSFYRLEIRMVFLYNRFGESMFFSAAAWQEILDNASEYGWNSAGTLPPPASFDLATPPETLTWDGNYTRALGQTVEPDDAIGLAAAVWRASQSGAEWHSNGASVIRSFPAFCRQRGFLISSNGFNDRSIKMPRPVSAPAYLRKIAS